MTTATINSKGQVTIPKSVRTRLGIGTGDRLEFVEIRDGVFQIVAATRDVRTLKGIVPKPEKPVTLEAMNQAVVDKGGKD
ncbi:MAG: AbrB/MazE/SpoVT family DNA-binding domain-containing protein [Gammaproteobacteria bacterium]|nr:AbrB/MazE/SpoVT family DNA-binding domain-containing protein [Gammaproteobacteria bacterium]